MVNRAQFRSAAKLATRNIVKHGDTDIFPFPFENHVFYDKQVELIDLIIEYDNNFDEYLARFPPRNVNSLTPVGYSGFRWATQIDSIWNAHFLACVLAISKHIERVRIDKALSVVFSYRYGPNKTTGDLFDRRFGWYEFMRQSIDVAADSDFVVACDISEFYPRLGHHRLENALKQIAGDTPYPTRIMQFLSNYSNHRSFGLPIGGPASRILSELTINQIDRLLQNRGVRFTRFADDFHIFCKSREEAYKHLVFLSEKLLDNQGLSLQKSKTRIMTSSEFRATNPLRGDATEGDPDKEGKAAAEQHQSRRLLRFSLKFDPYSPTADDDYEQLRSELKKFDIIGLLKAELGKSRLHAALARKIVAAVRFLEPRLRDEAILSIVANGELLYPIFASVLQMLAQIYENLSESAKVTVSNQIRQLINAQSHIMRIDVHLSFAIRVLAHDNNVENHALLEQLYEQRASPLIRRDIILVLARWGDWYWLSDLRNRFRELSAPERRAFIVASYKLKDEGSHWRDHIAQELSPFEKLVMKWAGEKASAPSWSAPI